LLYSHSRLRAFENCPLQFRYRYLDRIESEFESIEAFNGKRVHEVLEALFRAIDENPRPPELDELLSLYDAAWERAWHSHVEVIKEGLTPADYQRMGRRCVATFYRGNWPFTGDRTLGLEVEIEFDLAGPESPRLRGIIDRVAIGETGELLIHDYKTSTYLPRQNEIMADLQLAIYQLGSVARWPGMEVTKLIWHFLSFGRRVTVRLGQSGLEEKRQEIGRRIQRLERELEAGNLPARPSALCRWCAYQELCPAVDARQGARPVDGRAAAPAPSTAPPAMETPEAAAAPIEKGRALATPADPTAQSPPEAPAPPAPSASVAAASASAPGRESGAATRGTGGLSLKPLPRRRPSALAQARRAAAQRQLRLL
jgi:putative RecB family exonuclease